MDFLHLPVLAGGTDKQGRRRGLWIFDAPDCYVCVHFSQGEQVGKPIVVSKGRRRLSQ